MDNPKYNKIVLKAKKEKVLEAIYLVTQKLNLAVPVVNFEGCPQEKENQLAHYHPDEHKICISEHQLRKQNLDEVWRTAIHEITHFFIHDHGAKFHRVENEISKIGWRPPKGTIFISGQDLLERDKRLREEQSQKHRNKNNKITVDKTRCNYNLCRKKRRLSQCPHCKRYFCKEHIRSIIPGKSENFEVGEPSYHPCPGYVDFIKKKEEAEIDAYSKALDSLSGKQNNRSENLKSDYETVQKTSGISPDSEYRILVHNLEEATTNLERIDILNEIEKLKKLYNLTPKNEEEVRIQKVITENPFTDKEWERIINKVYLQYGTTGFGDEYGSNRWNKKQGIFKRILDALGFK